MVSINNSYAANRAVLASLRQTNADLATTQNRIGSGYKVASAKDNASVWAAAQSIRADLKTTDGIKSDLTIAKGRADITTAALGKITDVLTNMKALLDETVANDAGNPARDAKLKGYQTQLKSIISGATFQGTNWLTSAADTDIKLGKETDAKLTFTPTQLLLGSAGEFYHADAKSNVVAMTIDAAATDLADMKTTIATALTTVSAYAAKTAGLSEALTIQSDFLDSMDDIRNNALSQLVDADMTEESAKLNALQVKQQLAYQALAIGNSSSQNILRLFQ